jgi:tmRNA-binding protein
MAKPTGNITQERAARRFHQMAVLERQIVLKTDEIASCRAHLAELKDAHEGLLIRLRTAARDEGELPLFNLDGDDD